MASSSFGTPSPVTPEMRKNGMRSFFARFSRSFTRFSSSVASILLAATICGFEAKAGSKSSSSRRTVSKSSTGSRPVALEMPQKLMAETEPAMRAFDQSRHVGDDEAAVAGQLHDAEVWRQRRERIVGDLRPRG